MTQTDRVLQQASSERGVTAVDFQLPNVIDGGPPILRVAARVNELAETWDIRVIGKRDKCVVYRNFGRLTAPPVAPIKDRDGWLRWHQCRQCFACFARPTLACEVSRGARVVLMSPANEPIRECRIAEVRAERARREQRDQENTRHAA